MQFDLYSKLNLPRQIALVFLSIYCIINLFLYQFLR
jgi:hypothetical protein